jgi:excisionase family DNA binding protein
MEHPVELEPWREGKDVARLLGIHEKTLRRMAIKGMPHLKTGRRYRFRLSEVERYLRAKEQT